MPARTQLRVGRLTRAHGLKGAIKVELYTDDPARRFTPGAKFTLQVPTSSKWHGKTLELLELRVYNGTPVAFFAGVTDRTEAESLVKAVLWIDQDPTEVSTEPDAWFVHQLAGLDVIRDGVRIGRVVRVDPMPAQDMLIIDIDGAETMVPFVKAIVPEVDLRAGRIVVTPPPGLLEDLETPDEPEEGATDEAASAAVVDEAPEATEGTVSDDAVSDGAVSDDAAADDAPADRA